MFCYVEGNLEFQTLHLGIDLLNSKQTLDLGLDFFSNIRSNIKAPIPN